MTGATTRRFLKIFKIERLTKRSESVIISNFTKAIPVDKVVRTKHVLFNLISVQIKAKITIVHR